MTEYINKQDIIKMITNAELQGYDSLTCTVLKCNIDNLKTVSQSELEIEKAIDFSEAK